MSREDREGSHRHGTAECEHAQPQHGGSSNKNRLAITLVLVVGYMIAELVGGWLTNSLALLADAGHMFSDAAALALSLFAMWITQRSASPQHTYAYYRAEILAALANGATLGAVSIYIFIEAFQRLSKPPEVQGPLMMGIAAGGLAINLAGLALLHEGRSHSLNIRGAWLHILSDALGSIAALGAGALIWTLGWNWADPAASVLIGILVIYSSWGLLKEAVAVLMEQAPGHLDVDQVRSALQQIPGVLEVHDLHIWTITSGMESLSSHIVVAEGHSHMGLLKETRDILHDRFGIHHITIQIEPAQFEERETAF